MKAATDNNKTLDPDKLSLELRLGKSTKVKRSPHKLHTVMEADAFKRMVSGVPDELLEALSLLPDVHFVGGCVRDALLGAPIADYDLVTTADIPVIEEKLQGAGAEVTVISERTRTLSVKLGGGSVELSAIPLKRTLADDLGERDYTINAIACSLTGEVIDPYGGVSDAQEGVLRVVRHMNISLDPLRIVRGARLAAHLGLHVPTETRWVLANDDLAYALGRQPERLYAEFRKAFSGKNPDVFIAYLGSWRTLRYIFEGIEEAEDGWSLAAKVKLGVGLVDKLGPDVLWHFLFAGIPTSSSLALWQWKRALSLVKFPTRLERWLVDVRGLTQAVMVNFEAGRTPTAGEVLGDKSYYDDAGSGVFTELPDNYVWSAQHWHTRSELSRGFLTVPRDAWQRGDVRLFHAWAAELAGEARDWRKDVLLATELCRLVHGADVLTLDKLEAPKEQVKPYVTGADMLAVGAIGGQALGRVLRDTYHAQLKLPHWGKQHAREHAARMYLQLHPTYDLWPGHGQGAFKQAVKDKWGITITDTDP